MKNSNSRPRVIKYQVGFDDLTPDSNCGTMIDFKPIESFDTEEDAILFALSCEYTHQPVYIRKMFFLQMNVK